MWHLPRRSNAAEVFVALEHQLVLGLLEALPLQLLDAAEQRDKTWAKGLDEVGIGDRKSACRERVCQYV